MPSAILAFVAINRRRYQGARVSGGTCRHHHSGAPGGSNGAYVSLCARIAGCVRALSGSDQDQRTGAPVGRRPKLPRTRPLRIHGRRRCRPWMLWKPSCATVTVPPLSLEDRTVLATLLRGEAIRDIAPAVRGRLELYRLISESPGMDDYRGGQAPCMTHRSARRRKRLAQSQSVPEGRTVSACPTAEPFLGRPPMRPIEQAQTDAVN